MTLNPNSFLNKAISRGFNESIGFDYTNGVKGNFLGSMGAGLSLAFTGYSFYSGYQENGILGGVSETAKGIGYNIAFSQAMGLGKIALAVAPTAAGLAGMHYLGKAGENKRRNIQRLEFSAAGQNIIMNSGAVTARQRAINALNDSRINARAALGNEAALLHTRYRY